MNCGVFSLREKAGVHWRPLVVEEPLAQVGCRVHGGRLDSFCPVAARDHTILLDEIVLCLQQEQLHTKAFDPRAHSLELLSQEGAMFPLSINVHGD